MERSMMFHSVTSFFYGNIESISQKCLKTHLKMLKRVASALNGNCSITFEITTLDCQGASDTTLVKMQKFTVVNRCDQCCATSRRHCCAAHREKCCQVMLLKVLVNHGNNVVPLFSRECCNKLVMFAFVSFKMIPKE